MTDEGYIYLKLHFIFIRPHRTWVRPIVTVRVACMVCQSVCLSVTIVSPAKTVAVWRSGGLDQRS